MPDKPMSRLFFWGMSLMLNPRYGSKHARETLQEMDLQPGYQLLDFGCGPGGYSLMAAKQVAPGGMVYALDIVPGAAEKLEKKAAKQGMDNIHTITSACETGLADGSMDVVMFFDLLHMLSEPDKVVAELRRVLKASGKLWVNCHHLTDEDIKECITRHGLFRFAKRLPRNLCFLPV